MLEKNAAPVFNGLGTEQPGSGQDSGQPTVKHNYDQGITPQTDLSVEVDLAG